MSQTKIEWADKSWNPVTGCTKISEGCRNCYAERMAKRLAGRCGYPVGEPFKVTLRPDRLKEPMKWRKPSRIFVCSMGDLFHDEVPEDFLMKVFSLMAHKVVQHHTFLILTKRPEKMKRFISGLDYIDWGIPWKHIWLGVTAENQEQADKRIPILLQIPAAVRFVSVEPMLGLVDLNGYFPFQGFPDTHDQSGISWVICGGESGPGARPMHPDWVRSLRDQCKASGTPFLFKQWGQYCPPSQLSDEVYEVLTEKYDLGSGPEISYPVGKKNAGRLLDGRIYDECPEVTP